MYLSIVLTIFRGAFTYFKEATFVMSLFRKILSLILAFHILGTSTVFAVEQHFCKEDLFSYSIFGNAEKCKNGQKKIRQSSCCHAPISSLEPSTPLSEEANTSPCCKVTRTISKLDLTCSEKGTHFSEIIGIYPPFSIYLPFTTDEIETEFNLFRPPRDERKIWFSLTQLYLI